MDYIKEGQLVFLICHRKILLDEQNKKAVETLFNLFGSGKELPEHIVLKGWCLVAEKNDKEVVLESLDPSTLYELNPKTQQYTAKFTMTIEDYLKNWWLYGQLSLLLEDGVKLPPQYVKTILNPKLASENQKKELKLITHNKEPQAKKTNPVRKILEFPGKDKPKK